MMKMLKHFLVFSFLGSTFATTAFAQTDLNKFMTSRDLLSSDLNSNINLRNSRSSAVTVYGIYVRQFAYVAPGESCDHATVMYPDPSGSPAIPENITAGSSVAPISINAGKNAAIGSNYLYNMIYGANFYLRINISSSPPGCALPGCTWGSDTGNYNWCIYLGALAPVTTSSGYTANVPPSSDAASSGSYDYNLISSSNYVYLGPISCNDQTLTCKVSNPQTQSF
jgi:hypothetical protein